MSGNPDARKLELVVAIPANLPKLICDERSIRQIFINLASNAAKFTPAGGKVTLFAMLLADGEMTFGVADTGSGIPKADQAKAFEAFSQADRDAARAGKGTGLGLPIVTGLVAAHGGRIDLHSKPGEGTRVTVTFPRARVLRTENTEAA